MSAQGLGRVRTVLRLANERFTIAAIPITNEPASDRANSGK